MEMMLNPRKIKQVTKSYTLNHVYESFCKEATVNISCEDFKAICKDFNTLLVDNCILKQLHFTMPYKLGIFYLRGQKHNPRIIKTDYKATKEAGHHVPITNEHSKGFHFRFHWHKGAVTNIAYFKFTLAFANRRRLAKWAKEGKVKFVNIRTKPRLK